jgi:hypothetical protein
VLIVSAAATVAAGQILANLPDKRPAVWMKAADAPGCAEATAHEPHFEDDALWPEVDGRPAFKDQKWTKARLLIWRWPGRSVEFDRRNPNWMTLDLMAPKNWINAATGEPATRRFDRETDVYFPGTPEGYSLLGNPNSNEWALNARHITLGENVHIRVRAWNTWGNLWIKKGAKLFGRVGGHLDGGEHSFVRNDNPIVRRHVPHWYEAKPGQPDPGLPKPKTIYVDEIPSIAQYMRVLKTDGASVEVCGTFDTNDELQIVTGTLIVGPYAQVSPGCRSSQPVTRKAILQLQTGAVFAKRSNQDWNDDMALFGVIRAGTPERPILKDCYLGFSYKDPAKENAGHSLVIHPGAKIEVHSIDLDKARLVVGWHGYTPQWRLPGDHRRDRFKGLIRRDMELPKVIEIYAMGPLELEGVRLDNLPKGGFRLPDPSAWKGWKNVEFLTHNAGPPQTLFSKLPGDFKHNPRFHGMGTTGID